MTLMTGFMVQGHIYIYACVCVCVCIYYIYIHNKYTEYAHIYSVNKNFYFGCD